MYLDPRVSDTDGDGMPDGFEAWMCDRAGGFDEVTQRYVCPYFDPLNASDQTDDPDEDGFDVNRDGFLTVAEQYTSPEEYRYGMPGNFTHELDGLWCSATLPQGSVLTQWPFISNGANASFVNILSACTTNVTGVVGEDLWLEPTHFSMIRTATVGTVLPFVHFIPRLEMECRMVGKYTLASTH